MSDTLAKVQEVFRETLQDDGIVLARETTAADIEDWDSLMHVTLMVSLYRSAFVSAVPRLPFSRMLAIWSI